MNDEANKWVDEILESSHHIHHVEINSDLFTQIEARLDSLESKIISLKALRISAAAASILLIINCSIAYSWYQAMGKQEQSSSSLDNPMEYLISDYKIYD